MTLKIKFIVLFFLICTKIIAQNSPFSGFGLGLLAPEGNIAQQLMGGTGVAHSNPFFINQINPALLVRNRSVIFDVNYSFKYQNLRDNTTSTNVTTGNLNSAALAFPITKKWTTSIGLKPYSNLEYNTQTFEQIDNSPFIAYYTYQGSGGLSNFFWSNGVSITPNFNVGLKASYLFGNVIEESVSELISSGQNSTISYTRRNNINQISFSPALSYRYALNKDRKYLHFGLVYDVSSNAKTRRIESFEQRLVGSVPTFIDTLSTIKGKTFIPSRLRVGVAYEKSDKYVFSLDFITQNWSNYKSFGVNEPYFTPYSQIALGAEWTPDTRSNSFWKRSTYRAGFNYTPTLLKVEGRTYNELNVSMGTSMAFSGGQGKLTYIHLGITAGKRGSIANGSLQERYVEAKLGASLSDILWFYRPKID